jgi:hypothetical protein
MIKQEIISCACGCGRTLEKYGKNKFSGNYYERRFIHGHNGKKEKTNKPRVVVHYHIKQEWIFCACGCGNKTRRYHKAVGRPYWHERRYIHNHHVKGTKQSPEVVQKRVATMREVVKTRKWKIRNKKAMAQRRENKKWKASVGHEAMKKKWDKRGRKPRINFKCDFCGKENSLPAGHRNGDSTLRFCNRDCRIKYHVGKNHPAWVGGAKEPYPSEWTPELRHSIRKRDRYHCQHCMKKPRRTLHVHHKDADKKNCSPANLISLCIVCHKKEQWRMIREGTPTP